MRYITDNKEAIAIAEATFNWCISKYPVNNDSVKAKLAVKFDRRIKKFYGRYKSGICYVYPNVCKTDTMIIKTVLHEYRHFFQMPKLTDMFNYLILSDFFTYNDHPYEIDANEFSENNYKACRRHLKRKGVI